jgi:hypothetical protein
LILEEKSTANYGGYVDQMMAVQSSLHKGTLNPNLELAKKFVLSDSLDKLSTQFNQLIL